MSVSESINKLGVNILRKYGETKAGGRSSKYVADGLDNHGMIEGLMRFMEVCDGTGYNVAKKMGLEEHEPSVVFLSIAHLLAAPILLGLTLLGEKGIIISDKLSKIKVRLPNATASAGVDWDWKWTPDS